MGPCWRTVSCEGCFDLQKSTQHSNWCQNHPQHRPLSTGNRKRSHEAPHSPSRGESEGVSRSSPPVSGCGLFWKFRECRSFRGVMEYSNALAVCGEDSTDLSLLCRLYNWGVWRNASMQDNTGRDTAIGRRITLRCLCFTYTPVSESYSLYQKSGALGISWAPYLYTTRTMILSVTRLRWPLQRTPTIPT